MLAELKVYVCDKTKNSHNKILQRSKFYEASVDLKFKPKFM